MKRLTYLLLMLLQHFIDAYGKEISNFYLDDKDMCNSEDGIHFHYISHEETVMVYSKNYDVEEGIVDSILNQFLNKKVRSCSLVIAPPYPSKDLQFLDVRIENFWMRKSSSGCDTTLELLESPANLFDHSVSLMADLGCESEPPAQLFTQRGFNIKIKFRVSEPDSAKYAFRLNITASKGPDKEDDMSIGVKIMIGAISAAVFIVIVVIVFKTIKLRLSLKDDNIIEENDARVPVTFQPRARSNTYTEEPGAETEGLVHTPPSYDESHQSYVVMNQPGYIDGNDEGCCPPSYEEALKMAKPDGDSDPTYANTDLVPKV